jgi:hypothetical protein
LNPYRDATGAQIEVATRQLAGLRREREEVERRYRSACASLEALVSNPPKAPLTKIVPAPQRSFSFRRILGWALIGVGLSIGTFFSHR